MSLLKSSELNRDANFKTDIERRNFYNISKSMDFIKNVKFKNDNEMMEFFKKLLKYNKLGFENEDKIRLMLRAINLNCFFYTAKDEKLTKEFFQNVYTNISSKVKEYDGNIKFSEILHFYKCPGHDHYMVKNYLYSRFIFSDKSEDIKSLKENCEKMVFYSFRISIKSDEYNALMVYYFDDNPEIPILGSSLAYKRLQSPNIWPPLDSSLTPKRLQSPNIWPPLDSSLIPKRLQSPNIWPPLSGGKFPLTMTILDLRKLASTYFIPGRSKMNKKELIECITICDQAWKKCTMRRNAT